MMPRWIPVRFVVVGIAIALIIHLVSQPVQPISRPSENDAIAQHALSVDDQLRNGQALLQREQYQDAIALLESIYVQAQQQGDILNQVQALNLLALVYQEIDELDETERAIAQSLSLLESQNASMPVVQQLLGQARSIEGGVDFAQGQYAEALLVWEQAEANYAQVEDSAKQAGSLINQAQALQALGFFVRSRQRLAQAEAQLSATTDVHTTILQLNSLAATLRFLGEYEEARRILDQAWAIAPQSSADDAATILINQGNTARAEGNLTEAIAFYQQAAALEISPSIQTQALLNQLDTAIEAGHDDISTLDHLVNSLCRQLDSLPSRHSEFYIHLHFVHSLLDIARQQNRNGTACGSSLTIEAARRLGQIAQQANRIGDRSSESYALGYLGSLYELTQQWNDAQQVTEDALLVAQSISAPEIIYEWQWQLGRILKQQGDFEEAIAAYRSAYDTLQSIRSDLLVTPSERQFSFRDSVEPIYREYVDLLLQRSPTPEQLAQARSVIESLQLAELNNFFRSTCLEGRQIALEAIDQTNTAVVYPIILPDRLELLLNLPNQPLRQYTIAIPQPELEQTLTEWRLQLEKPYTAPEGRALGEQLYARIIAPIESDLAANSVRTLTFVLDGVLRNVPMAALYDGDRYLIERYSLALAPGLRLLDPAPLQQQKLTVLAAGLSEARYGFSPLIAVEQELDYVQSVLPSEVLLNQDFTRDRLEQELTQQSFSIIHLATHGQFSSNAQDTFVLAWDSPILVNELSTLLRVRTEDLTETLELLILSACETATGDRRAALGLAGVAVQAGARSTLASLWSLDDASGAEFIRQFYEAIATTPESKADALQQAQQAMLALPNYRHPRYWAPYVLLGNWL